jgi:hypothetical protein
MHIKRPSYFIPIAVSCRRRLGRAQRPHRSIILSFPPQVRRSIRRSMSPLDHPTQLIDSRRNSQVSCGSTRGCVGLGLLSSTHTYVAWLSKVSRHYNCSSLNFSRVSCMIAAIYAPKSIDQHGISDEEKSVTRRIEHAKAYARGKGWRSPIN